MPLCAPFPPPRVVILAGCDSTLRYYVFATCEDPDNRKGEGGLFAREHSEADSFWCFCNLMADLRDNFCVSLDHTTTGVGGTLLRLEDLLRSHDAPLHQHLVEDLGLVPQMFALRWITVLFSQEFHLPDVLTLWDAILCQKDRLDFSLHVCLAMLDMIRPSLIDAGAVCVCVTCLLLPFSQTLYCMTAQLFPAFYRAPTLCYPLSLRFFSRDAYPSELSYIRRRQNGVCGQAPAGDCSGAYAGGRWRRCCRCAEKEGVGGRWRETVMRRMVGWQSAGDREGMRAPNDK